jgi:predicted RNA-binding protein with PIN domain
MSIHIVIDGYNLIRQSSTLSAIEHHSLEEGREALLQRLDSYKRVKRHPITVVFDGADAEQFMELRTRWKGIRIVFSRPGELADATIKRIVTRERQRIVVVTSDRELADFVARHGATTMDSKEFETKMVLATHGDMPEPGLEKAQEGWKPTTKKKGPSRRMSKGQRKSRSKTRKL